MAKRSRVACVVLLIASFITFVIAVRTPDRFSEFVGREGVVIAQLLMGASWLLAFMAIKTAIEAGKGTPMSLNSLSKGKTYIFRSEMRHDKKFLVVAEDDKKQLVIFVSPVSLEAANGNQFMRASSTSVAFIHRVTSDKPETSPNPIASSVPATS